MGLSYPTITHRRFLTISVATAAASAMLAASAVPTAAQNGDIDDGRPGGDGEFVLGTSVEVDLGPAIEQAANGGSTNDLYWASHRNWSASGDPDDDNQGWCTGQTWVSAPTQEEAEQLARDGDAGYVWFHEAFFPANDYDGVMMSGSLDCPEETQEPPELSPDIIVDILQGEVEGQLPRPQLIIPPSYALTGLPAYLVTGTEHALSHSPSLSVELGPWTYQFEVSAEGTSTVDWGDGTVTTHDEPGLHYPDGTVTHTYTDRGFYDVTMTDTWTMNIQLVSPVTGSASYSADLDPVVLEDFEVREYRSVRL